MTDARAENRKRMPLIAAGLDDFRRVFGDGVKLRYASEGGHELGDRKLHDEVQAELAEGRK